MQNSFMGGHVFIFFATISLSTYFLSLTLSSIYFNFLSLFILIIMAFYWIKEIKSLWIFLYLLFVVLFASFVSVLIEFMPVYLSEVGKYSYLTGSAARNISLMIFFLSTTIYIFYLFSRVKSELFKPIKYVDQLLLKLMLYIAALVLGYIFFVIWHYGSPLTMGVDRFSYMKNIVSSEFQYIYSLVILIGFVVSYAAATEKIKPTWAKIWFIFTVIELILIGEKFSKIFLLTIVFFTPFIILGKTKINVSKFLTATLIFFGLSFMLIMYSYKNIYGGSFFEVFKTRLGLQAQMIFAIDILVQSGINGFGLVTKAFMGIGASVGQTGIYYLMYLIAPDSLVDAFMKKGATFTMPFPANFNYFFGYYFSPIPLLVFATFTGFAANLLVKSIQKHNFILSIISYKFLYNIFINIVMGEMYYFFTWKFAVYILIFLLYFVVSISTLKSS